MKNGSHIKRTGGVMKRRSFQMKVKVLVLSEKILLLAALSLFCVVAAEAQIAPLPASQENIYYEPAQYPTPSLQAAYAKPIGVGSVAGTGDNVALQVALPQFSGPVDVYCAIHAPFLNPELFLIKSDLSLVPLSSGLAKWRDNVTAPIEESLYGSIPVKSFPPGTYYLYLLITPHDDFSRYAFYTTSFVIPPSQMAPPTGQESFALQAAALPVVHTIAGKASPIGLGSAAVGGDNLTVRIGLPEFSSPVDVYLATYWPAVDPVNIYLVNGLNELSPLSSGLVKWKENHTRPVSEIVMSVASMAVLPPGAYTFYLAVTPAGSLEHFFFWSAEVSSTTLVVDTFGNGVVTSNIGGINCGDECSASYQPGTAVILTATPDADSVFQSWEGCDAMPGWTPNNKTCTVTINANRTVQPTFALKETKLDPSVRILDAAAVNFLLRQDGAAYYFDPQIMSVLPLQAGDIIISTIAEQTGDALDNARTGFIRRIVSITTSQNELKIETEDATLEDAVIEGTFFASAEDLEIDLAATQLESGVRIVAVRRVGGKPEIELEIDKVIDDVTSTVAYPAAGISEGFDRVVSGVTLKGRITLAFEPDLGLHIGCCVNWVFPYVKDFRAILKITNTNELTASVTGNFQGEARVKIAQHAFKPMVIGCCLVIVPKARLYLGVDGNADAGVTAGVTVETSLKAGVKYKRKKGWSPVGETTVDTQFQEPTVSADASLRGFVSPELAMLFYGAGGPFVNAKGYLKMEAWAPPLSWLLSAGIEGCVGAEVKILGKGLRSPEWCPVGYEWPLKRGGAGGILEVTPAEGFSSSGPIGGPFSPSEKMYTLKNTGHAPIEWSASASEWWVQVEKHDIMTGFQQVSSLVGNAATIAARGNLDPGDSVNITVSLSPGDVSIGAHTASVDFFNLTNGDGNTSREVSLTVKAQNIPLAGESADRHRL